MFEKMGRQLIMTLASVCCLFMLCGVKAEADVIYTGNTKVDAAAEKIIERCTTDNMTSRQKLKAVYQYLVKKMRYSHSRGPVRVKVSKKDKKALRVKKAELKQNGVKIKYSSRFRREYDNLITMQGTCKDMSGVFCILANHLGYRAGYVTGTYIRRNGTTTEHWWNYVIIQGKKYYCDVQAANCSWGKSRKESASTSFYLQSAGSKEYRKHHR